MIKKYLTVLGISGIVAVVLAGCGGTPQPTPAADVQAIKADNAKHDAAMKAAVEAHAAQAAQQAAQDKARAQPTRGQ